MKTDLGDLGGRVRAPLLLARLVVLPCALLLPLVALVTCVHAALWGLAQRQYSSPDINGQLASVSYSPYTRWQHPDNGDRPTPEQIRSDLRLLSSYTRSIRTYSSTGGHELIPAIAQEFGLKVTIGIWLSGMTEEPSPGKRRDPREIERNQKRNESEIVSAIALARRYTNVSAIVVGNETLLRNDMSAKELMARHSTSQARKPGAGHDRRDVGRLASRHARPAETRRARARPAAKSRGPEKHRGRTGAATLISSPLTSCLTGTA